MLQFSSLRPDIDLRSVVQIPNGQFHLAVPRWRFVSLNADGYDCLYFGRIDVGQVTMIVISFLIA